MSGTPILCQVHIPKCAGSSVEIWLRDAALSGSIAGFRALYPGYAFTSQAQLQALGFDDPRLVAVTTHNIQRYWPAVCGRPMLYFTLLREPVEQFGSVVRYFQQERAAIGLPESVGTSARDIAEWMLDGPLAGTTRENPQTQHLTLHMWCAATNGRCVPEERDRWSPLDEAAYQRDRLPLAKAVLQSFLAVGTVERLEETLGVLRRRSAQYGIHLLPLEKLERHNGTRVSGDDVVWTGAGPLAERVRASRAVDRELYAFAQALLDESVQRNARLFG